MPASEKLTNIIREAFVDLPDVEEKKMFSGVCFMVDGKMCMCVNQHEILCRVAPDILADALERNGTRPMIQGGRQAKNFIYVHEDVLQSPADFRYWIGHVLAFNKIAEPAKSKAKRK